MVNIIVPVIVGILIGIIEVVFLAQDEFNSGVSSFMKDAWHAFLFSIVLTLIAVNLTTVLKLDFIPGFVQKILFINTEKGTSIVASILITIIALAKMVVAHGRKIRLQGTSEKFWHLLIIGLAIGFSPYYIFAFYDIPAIANIAKSRPSWLPL